MTPQQFLHAGCGVAATPMATKASKFRLFFSLRWLDVLSAGSHARTPPTLELMAR